MDNETARFGAPASRRDDWALVGRHGLWLGLVLLAALGVYEIQKRSFWLDESYTWTIIAQPTWSGFVDALDLTASNMFGYLTLLRLWSAGGESEVWLRLPSLAFALGTVIMVHRTARRIGGSSLAGVAALTAGSSVPLLYYGLEARSYAMLAFFSALSWDLLIAACRDDRRRQWLMLGVATLLAASAHVIALLAIPSIGLATLLRFKVRDAVVRMLPVGAAGGVAAIGVLLSSERDTAGFPPPLSPSVIVRSARFLLGDHGVLTRDGSGFALILLVAALIVIGAVGLARSRAPRSDDRWIIWIWLVGPPVTITVVSLVSPVLWHRMLIGSLPAVFIVVAMAIVQMQRRRLGAVVLIALVALGAVRSLAIADDDQDQFDDLAAALLERAEPGDVLIFDQPYERAGLDYYLRDQPEAFLTSPPLGPVLEYGELITHQAFLDELPPDATIWVVDRADGAPVWAGDEYGDDDFSFANFDSLVQASIHGEPFDVDRFRIRPYRLDER